MIKKLTSFATVVAVVCCLAGTSVYGKSASDPKEPVEKSPAPAEKTQPNEKLKADMAKLVSDAKAGKLKMPAPALPQPRRNNWSKGATIGVIAAIVGTIIAIVICNKLTSDND